MKKLIITTLLTLYSMLSFGQDRELPSFISNSPLYKVSAGTCASPDGPDKYISAPPANYNYLNSNGYCYTVSPAVKDYVGCFTLIATSTTINFNAGYNATGCTGLLINYARLYTTTGCVLVNGAALGSVSGLIIGTNYTWCISLKCTGPGPGFSTMCPYYQIPSTLPIELVAFNGFNYNSDNLLLWRTASESNNDFFTIERSDDGLTWIKVINIDGAGNSTNTREYVYRDYSFSKNAINYYRLKQIDFNGQYEYSGIISVDNYSTKVVKSITTYNLTGVETTPTNLGMYIQHIEYTDKTLEVKKLIIQ